MKAALRILVFIGELSCAGGSAILGTIAAADPNPKPYALLWWIVSLISFFRLLTIRQAAQGRAPQTSIVLRATFAALFLFCIVMVTGIALFHGFPSARIVKGDLYLTFAMATLFVGLLAVIFRRWWLSWQDSDGLG
jgi:FtsH-binding integral membrane protein